MMLFAQKKHKKNKYEQVKVFMPETMMMSFCGSRRASWGSFWPIQNNASRTCGCRWSTSRTDMKNERLHRLHGLAKISRVPLSAIIYLADVFSFLPSFSSFCSGWSANAQYHGRDPCDDPLAASRDEAGELAWIHWCIYLWLITMR